MGCQALGSRGRGGPQETPITLISISWKAHLFSAVCFPTVLPSQGAGLGWGPLLAFWGPMWTFQTSRNPEPAQPRQQRMLGRREFWRLHT